MSAWRCVSGWVCRSVKRHKVTQATVNPDSLAVLSTVQPRVPKFYPTRRRGGYHYRYGIVAADKVYRGACGRSIRLVVMRHGAFCLRCWEGQIGRRGGCDLFVRNDSTNERSSHTVIVLIQTL